MKILLDTNIIIHREGNYPTNKDIGVLYKWIDNLHHLKYVHPITVNEISRLKAQQTKEVMSIKLDAYNILQAPSSLIPSVKIISDKYDKSENDRNDTLLLNELVAGHVDILITEDRGISNKASLLGLSDKVFTIESYLEKVVSENPGLSDYKILSVRKELFGNISVKDPFFDNLRNDYYGFDTWFARKSEESVYICRTGDSISAFLYLKVEGDYEPYPDITPQFSKKRRLKIGTLKVALNGYRLGERFLKIAFDNAILNRVEEIYFTIFDKTIEQKRLISLFEDYGFILHGNKGDELVYTRSMQKVFNTSNPKMTYPYYAASDRAFIVPIYPEYHTNLFPDSILRTESPANFVENEPYRNAISKVYVCRSRYKDLRSGDTIIFYRTGGYYKSVVTTVGIVESVHTNVTNGSHFIQLCRKRSIFSDEELIAIWNRFPSIRPFVVNFLYTYSFPKRINLKRLIELGIISDIQSAPRGFEPLTNQQLTTLLRETQSDDALIVH